MCINAEYNLRDIYCIFYYYRKYTVYLIRNQYVLPEKQNRIEKYHKKNRKNRNTVYLIRNEYVLPEKQNRIEIYYKKNRKNKKYTIYLIRNKYVLHKEIKQNRNIL